MMLISLLIGFVRVVVEKLALAKCVGINGAWNMGGIMSYLDGWMADSTTTIDAAQIATRAVDAWNAIQDNPESITFVTTDNATIAAQTFRVEYDDKTRPI